MAAVAAEVVHDDDVAGLERRDEHRLDVSAEALAIDCAVEEPWGVDAVMAKRGEEGGGLPTAVRDARFEP